MVIGSETKENRTAVKARARLVAVGPIFSPGGGKSSRGWDPIAVPTLNCLMVLAPDCFATTELSCGARAKQSYGGRTVL
jgi:hypothetical protein